MPYTLHYFRTVDSTMNEAARRIADGRARDNAVILARAQTNGRGRNRGRIWNSPRGNIFASIMFQNVRAADKPLMSYAAACAVADAMIRVGVDAKIKWPNDILINGKKVCGILIEYVNDWAIVGIGVNVSSHPDLTDSHIAAEPNYTPRPAAHLGEFVPDLEWHLFFRAMLDCLDFWTTALTRDRFDDVRRFWMANAFGLNQPVRYRGAVGEIFGINDSGKLILKIGGDFTRVVGDEIKFI